MDEPYVSCIFQLVIDTHSITIISRLYGCLSISRIIYVSLIFKLRVNLLRLNK